MFEAASLTAAVVIALTIYALTTKNDFTVCGPVAYILLILVIMGSILSAFFGPTLKLLWCILGVFVFSFYIVIDTQMIVGNERARYKFEEDSYILASVVLYIDIINLFLEILKLLGDKK